MIYNNIALYKAWAPDDAEWTAWAKPVLFTDEYSLSPGYKLDIPEIPTERDFKTMVIVDLPGTKSVEAALAFAAKGYRPVPLYNGTTGSGKMLVDVRELKIALSAGADMLRSLSLPSGSPPVFMLDSDRMTGCAGPGLFDNRWCIFPQDMPSSQLLNSKGINKITVRTDAKPQADLERILFDYQKDGMQIFTLDYGNASPRKYTARKQSYAKELAYRFKVNMKLKRNATGGFGGKIPDVYETNDTRVHYYRYG